MDLGVKYLIRGRLGLSAVILLFILVTWPGGLTRG